MRKRQKVSNMPAVLIRVPPEIKAFLEDDAERNGRNMQQHGRMILTRYVESLQLQATTDERNAA